MAANINNDFFIISFNLTPLNLIFNYLIRKHKKFRIFASFFVNKNYLNSILKTVDNLYCALYSMMYKDV